MANAFRDPYWRAQVAHEVEVAPGAKAEIEGLCLRCHGPIVSHQARMDGVEAPAIELAVTEPLARDGVSCTVCHKSGPERLGTPESFSGLLALGDAPIVYGPYPEPSTGPMRMHTGFTPTHGEHISSSALCGACHTLYTRAAGASEPFLEQAPYLEWLNSEFNDESGASETSRSCVQCHMPDEGTMRIARSPMGTDFVIQIRDHVRGHTFVGGNAFLLDLLRENAAELGVTATAQALARTAAATRAQLAHSTAKIEIRSIRRSGAQIEFDVHVENLCGHKLPSGYPSRRAWLDVEVRSGRTTLFESGAVDASGRLAGVADELALPHFERIEAPEQVAVFEMIGVDAAGRPTTSLAEMVRRTKDTRLLPRGWRADGPHADETRPIGTETDSSFAAGGDVVSYRVAIQEEAQGTLTLVARLLYQPIPPAWADGLRDSKTPEAAAFLRMYDAADKAPETIALTVELVE